ncbi:MAG: DivIVA domain-containing protein [Oscillospiraceae bacterium]|jgi:cell division initiation protein|nr:DivIVA domain-containing protein [Oscillospiraceae bacterium]
MLSLSQVRDARFSRAVIGGYKPCDVDKFLDEIQDTFREMSIQHNDLKEEIECLKRKIDQFRSEEATIRRAIINSQQIAEASVIDAGVKSKYILKDASEKANKMMSIAKSDAKKKLNISKRLYEHTEKLKGELIKRFEEQIAFLKNLPCDPITEIEEELFSVDSLTKNFNEEKEIFSNVPEKSNEDANANNEGGIRAKFLSELAIQNGVKDKYKNSNFEASVRPEKFLGSIQNFQ